MKKWISNNATLVIIALCLCSRLPMLLSPNLFLDGDECIVGLMAKHFSEGMEMPWFFYGQAYGFSFVEVFFVSIFYAFLGVSDIAIKLSMLLLWTLGIVLFYKTLRQIEPNNSQWTAFLVTLLFVFFPAWAIWSMKARGGYLTAFFLSSLITYMLFNKKGNSSPYILLIGFLMVVIYQSQPLWLAGLIPIAGYQLYQAGPLRSIIKLGVGMAIGALLFRYLKADLSVFWSPEILSFSNFDIASFLAIPNQVYQSLTGSYDYGIFIQPGIITRALAFIFSAFILLTLPISLFYFLTRKKASSLFYVFCLAVLFTVGYLLVINDASPRYLLPLFGYAALLLYQLLINSKRKALVNTVLYTTIFFGAISMYSFKHHVYEEANKAEIVALIDELESRDIHYVYCNGGLLQWQISLYSNERVTARYHGNMDRYPKYIARVDSAYRNVETKVAMVGFLNPSNRVLPSDIIPIKGRYYIYENPNDTVLEEYGFNLKKFKKKQ